MRIYIAASHPRHLKASGLAVLLSGIEDVEIVSTWHGNAEREGYQTDSFGRELIEPDFGGKDMSVEAARDMEEVQSADVLVVLTGDNLTRGGRHSELGIALGHGLHVAILGPREQIFHYHPEVHVFQEGRLLLDWVCGLMVSEG